MEGLVDIIFFIIIISTGFVLNRIMKWQFPNIQVIVLDLLYIFHLLMALGYYLYALSNNSDSHAYFNKVILQVRGESWIDYFATGTPFIEFVAWPFIQVFNLKYESLMLLFAFFGYVGLMFFYLFFKENIRFKHYWLGAALMPLVFFLPNLHFWSGSLGKGSIILMGIGAFFFSLSKPFNRWPLALLSLPIIYFVRPHMAFIFLASIGIALLLGNKDLKVKQKVALFLVSTITLGFLYQSVFQYVGIEGEGGLIDEGFEMTSNLANKLSSRADSGVDISNFNLFQKIFVFLYFPIFFNANGILGFFVSFENLFYLLISFQLIRSGFIKFFFNTDFITKTAFIAFVGSAVALAQISGNFGIAIRMKSMVMLLFLFVVLRFMDQKQWRIRVGKWKRYSRQLKLTKKNKAPVVA
jgi:hypothetical protein